jgi:hypothetical protein
MRTIQKISCLMLFNLLSLVTSAQGLVGIYFTKDLSGETNYPMILGIVDESPAEKAGLKIGQRIISIDGRDADLTKTSQETVLSWVKGPTGTTLELRVTQPDDVTKSEIVKLTRGALPTAANKLTNVASVSKYFPMRLWSCIKAMEDRDQGMTLQSMAGSESYNGKEVKRWRVTAPFMNEIQEGVYESYTDESVILKRDVYNDKLTFVMVEGIENDFLAAKYYEDTKAVLNKALENNDGTFGAVSFSEGDETLEKQGESAYNFGSFSKETDTSEKWESWENRTFMKLTSFHIGRLGKTQRAAYYAQVVYLKLIGDGYSWKVVLEIELQSTL